MLRFWVCLGIIWAISAKAFCQDFVQYSSFWDNYLIKNLLPEDGLIVDQIQYVYPDKGSFTWIVTAGGIIRYDGITFKPYRKGLDRGYFYELHKDSQGNFWAPATGEGIYKLQGDSLIKFKEALDSDDGLSKTMLINHKGTIYIGVYGNGLFIFDGEKTTQKFRVEDGLVGPNIWKIIEDKKGKIWIGTDEGLSIFDGKNFTNFTTANGLPYNTIRGLAQMNNGDVWVGTDKEGIVVFRDEKPYKYYHIKDGLNGSFPQFFAQNPVDSSIWIGDHGGGVNRFKNGEFQSFTEEDGLVNNYVLFIGFSKKGTAYIGTEKGMTVLNPRKVDVLNSKTKGLVSDPYISVIEDGYNNVWLGSDGTGWNFFKNGIWNTIENPAMQTNGYSNGAIIDPDGMPWFSTQGSGFFKVNSDFSIEKVITTENGLADNMVLGLEFDEEDNLYAATTNGVSVFNRKLELINTYNSDNKMPFEYSTTTTTDKDSAIWVGTYGGGLFRFKGNEVTQYDTSSGLSHPIVYTILQHSSGKLLVGTSRGGLNIFNGSGFDFFGEEKGFPDFAAYGMAEDLNGNVWISSNDGLYLFEQKEIEKLDKKNDSRISYTMYTKEDGLPNNAMEPITNSNTTTLHSGQMLFSSSSGVAVVDPQKAKIDTSTFFPYIDEFRVNEHSINFENSPRIPHDQNRLDISFSALNLEAPNKTRFRVWLSGVDKHWINTGLRTTAYYDYLPHGDYTFTVSAIGPDGMWSNKTASIDFTVLPPFYNTWWFRLLLLLSFAGLVAGIVQWRNSARLKILNRELAYQHKIQQERERISRDLHDNVGSQITNLITGIEIGSMHNQKFNNGEVSKILNTLDIEARNTMTDLRETIWLLDKEEVPFSAFIDHLRAYLNRQKQFLGTMQASISSEINKELVLNPTQSLNMMRIIQEALNNARKYAEATTFQLHFLQENGALYTEISDNGKGMNLNESAKIGNGLGNMKERAELIGAEIKLESSPDIGTLIQLKLPFNLK